MVETRVAPRYRVAKPAKIEYGGDKIACTIRDLSVTGAAIEIADRATVIPTKFTLIVPEDGLRLPCHLVVAESFSGGYRVRLRLKAVVRLTTFVP